MARTRKQAWKEWHGFAIELKPDTDLRIGMLIAEYAGGSYEPIACVSTINEGKEIELPVVPGLEAQAPAPECGSLRLQPCRPAVKGRT